MRSRIILFLFMIPSLGAIAQGYLKDSSILVPIIPISYSVQVPGGDLADRFGYNNNVGLGLLFKTKKNWIIGGNGSFLFGNKIKEDGILDSISTSSGFIIDQNGQFAEVRLFERGFTWAAQFGRLIPKWGPNPNSGIFFTLGLGGMSHKIRIEDIGNRSPQLKEEYKKGYDRLTTGYMVSQFLGYMYLDNKRRINFFFGLEASQGFTQSRRSYNFDTMSSDTKSRVDMLYGIKAGWILPLYKRTANEFYFN
jgi:hypothetical protein